jgi:uncharacterized membrane protein HdeD (DUF308 family)
MDPGLSPLAEETLRERLAQHWKWLLAGGVLAVVLGAIAIIVPPIASVATATFVGWLLIIGAGFVVASAFQERRFWPIALRILLALLWVWAGFWLLAAPLTGTITLTFVLIAWLLADGVMRIVGALLDRDHPSRAWFALGGVLSIVLAVLIWLDFPSSAAWAIGLLVGVNMLFFGATMISLGWTGRQLSRTGLRLTPSPAA